MKKIGVFDKILHKCCMIGTKIFKKKLGHLYLLSIYIYSSSQVSEPITASAVDLGSCCAARGVSAKCADICRAPQLQYSALVARPQVI